MDFDEVKLLRERIITLEDTVKHLTSIKAQAEVAHQQAIAYLQERIIGMLDTVRLISFTLCSIIFCIRFQS